MIDVYAALQAIIDASNDNMTIDGINAISSVLKDQRIERQYEPVVERKTNEIYDCGYTMMVENDRGAISPPGPWIDSEPYYAAIYIWKNSVMVWMSHIDYPVVERDAAGELLSAHTWMATWRVVNGVAKNMFYDANGLMLTISDVIEVFERAMLDGVQVVV